MRCLLEWAVAAWNDILGYHQGALWTLGTVIRLNTKLISLKLGPRLERQHWFSRAGIQSAAYHCLQGLAPK